jgi:hypothetical protein
VTRVLPPAEIEKAFDLREQLRHVDDIFARVFGVPVAAGEAEEPKTRDRKRKTRDQGRQTEVPA